MTPIVSTGICPSSLRRPSAMLQADPPPCRSIDRTSVVLRRPVFDHLIIVDAPRACSDEAAPRHPRSPELQRRFGDLIIGRKIAMGLDPLLLQRRVIGLHRFGGRQRALG